MNLLEFRQRREPKIHGDSVLGQKTGGANRDLQVFDLEIEEVVYTSDEVTALCPVTGQPDWYTVQIVISHSKLGLESKSLKLYLQSFRNDGIFCEHFAQQIARDVFDATNAPTRVTVIQKPRGGIEIEAHAFEAELGP